MKEEEEGWKEGPKAESEIGGSIGCVGWADILMFVLAVFNYMMYTVGKCVVLDRGA